MLKQLKTVLLKFRQVWNIHLNKVWNFPLEFIVLEHII